MLDSSLSTYLVHIIVIYSDGAFLEQVLYLHFLRHSRDKSKFFPTSLGLDCFQLTIIVKLKSYFGKANFAPPTIVALPKKFSVL